jgi:hypothetical protein
MLLAFALRSENHYILEVEAVAVANYVVSIRLG